MAFACGDAVVERGVRIGGRSPRASRCRRSDARKWPCPWASTAGAVTAWPRARSSSICGCCPANRSSFRQARKSGCTRRMQTPWAWHNSSTNPRARGTMSRRPICNAGRWNSEHVEPVIRSRAESVPLHELPQVDIRGDDQPGLEHPRRLEPIGSNSPGFDHAEQLHLLGGIQRVDFVEQQRRGGAASNPCRSSTGPALVNAPLTPSNSSVSIRSGGIAPVVSDGQKVLLLGAETVHGHRASARPAVPVSPTEEGATRPAMIATSSSSSAISGQHVRQVSWSARTTFGTFVLRRRNRSCQPHLHQPANRAVERQMRMPAGMIGVGDRRPVADAASISLATIGTRLSVSISVNLLEKLGRVLPAGRLAKIDENRFCSCPPSRSASLGKRDRSFNPAVVPVSECPAIGQPALCRG